MTQQLELKLQQEAGRIESERSRRPSKKDGGNGKTGQSKSLLTARAAQLALGARQDGPLRASRSHPEASGGSGSLGEVPADAEVCVKCVEESRCSSGW